MTILTRKAEAERLEAIGITGAAQELLLRISAPLRHQSRVEATKAAALAAVNGDKNGAALLLVLDLLGVGSHDLTHRSTRRVPCFAGLGSGRKQARDGEVFMAAARQALVDIDGGHGVVINVNAGGDLTLRLIEGRVPVSLKEVEQLSGFDLSAWGCALLAEILINGAEEAKIWLQAGDGQGAFCLWFGASTFAGPGNERATLAEFAQAYNRLCAERERNQQEMPATEAPASRQPAESVL